MRGLTEPLENHHGVRILDEAVEDAVRLSHRYISGRQLPDKSVSVLDTACARVAIGQAATPPAVEDAQRAIDHGAAEIEALAREEATGVDHKERLGELAAKKAAEEEKLAGLKAQWDKERDLIGKIREVRSKLEDLAAPKKKGAAAASTKPAGPEAKSAGGRRGSRDARGPAAGPRGAPGRARHPQQGAREGAGRNAPHAGLRRLADHRRGHLRVDRDPRREDADGRDPDGASPEGPARAARHRPVARPRGDRPAHPHRPREPDRSAAAHRRLSARRAERRRQDRDRLTLAEALYGGERNLVTINMSEYQEAHTVSSLKGSPPGYVGYGEGGVLTEAVRRKPYSVVLLDEVEKAHPDVMELFYQVFDKGMLEDGEGREIDFKNTVILLTSNAATDTMMKLCADPETAPEPEKLVEAIRPELIKIFKPALLGRMVIVPYYPISDKVMRQIIKLQLGRIGSRLQENHGASFSYDDAVINEIPGRCKEVESGARNVDHILTRTLLPGDVGRVPLPDGRGPDDVARARNRRRRIPQASLEHHIAKTTILYLLASVHRRIRLRPASWYGAG